MLSRFAKALFLLPTHERLRKQVKFDVERVGYKKGPSESWRLTFCCLRRRRRSVLSIAIEDSKKKKKTEGR